MQIGELVNILLTPTENGHDGNCPFCTSCSDPDFTTYVGGEDKNGALKLRENMQNEKRVEGGARPKDGAKEGNQSENQTPIYDARSKQGIEVGEGIKLDGINEEQWAEIQNTSVIEKNKKGDDISINLAEDKISESFGEYSTETHHLISGKQALAKSNFARWILKDKKTIEKNTGYSVNNGDNGLFLPSIPEIHNAKGKLKDKVKIKWSALPPLKKYKAAFRVMAATRMQFHIGHHDIDIEGEENQEKPVHISYSDYLEIVLRELDKRMNAWAMKCSEDERGSSKGKKKGEFQPTIRVNRILDLLSFHMLTKISTKSPELWDVFISKYAYEFHKPICGHKLNIKP